MWIFEKLKCVNLRFCIAIYQITSTQNKDKTTTALNWAANKTKTKPGKVGNGHQKQWQIQIHFNFFNRGSFFLSVGGTHKVWRWCQAWLFPKLLRFRKTWESWNGLLLLCFADIQTLHFVWEKFSYTYKITVFWIVHLSHRLSVYYKH